MPLARTSLCLSLALAMASPVQAEEVMVFAAASLKTALDQVAADFTATTGHQVIISYAGSNQLAQQIIAGAPADVFLSAAPSWMDEVEKSGLVVPGTRTDLLGNTLVLIAHGADAPPVTITADLDLAALLGDQRLAMALVDAVPAGQYGKAALQSLGLWDSVEANVAQADNVRAALALVASGEAPFGIVYASDAVAENGVTVVGIFPADSHPEITYPVALLTNAAAPADQAFLEALRSDASDAIFAAQGFDIVD
jgi:molybdate transport system substrate-binding protein